MADNIPVFKGTGIFIITERIYSRDAPNWHGLGATMLQIHKMVFQLSRKQDSYLDGAKVTSANVTLWQNIRILAGAELLQRDSAGAELEFFMEYSGSRFMATPVSGIDSKKIPSVLTKEYSLPTSEILAFGHDPLPNVNIYGRPDANFMMNDGGKGTPEAAAKYDKKTGQLIMVKPGHELSTLMNKLNKPRGHK
ncbi:hypothetical protein BS639_18380 [Rouxiella silvae]|uniref:Uncharacterized protein n=1 Tax=Rouxiella silvae TaxID=1646373 RepID=A0AA41BXT9_9GAMM|nr:hypothetical protein [Rouxiella silvae]MBF6638521.1 hypothetical protein [Rouxiella silvae]ORJ19801.1 hypothetical protein BS639_18380 [Rouxiella silvae]